MAAAACAYTCCATNTSSNEANSSSSSNRPHHVTVEHTAPQPHQRASVAQQHAHVMHKLPEKLVMLRANDNGVEVVRGHKQRRARCARGARVRSPGAHIDARDERMS